MVATVRMFTFPGVVTAADVAGQNLAYDSVKLLKWPYLGSETLTATTGGAQSTNPANAPTNTKLAFVQVQNGKTVYYELTPDGHTTRNATTNSPSMAGDVMLQFGPGWSLSVLEM